MDQAVFPEGHFSIWVFKIFIVVSLFKSKEKYRD